MNLQMLKLTFIPALVHTCVRPYLSFHIDPTSFLLCAAIKTSEDVMASYKRLLDHIKEYSPVQLEDLEMVCSLSHVIVTTKGSVKTERHIQEVLAGYVQQILTSPVISLLDVEAVWREGTLIKEEGKRRKYPDRDFSAMVKHFRATQSSQVHIINVLLMHIVTVYRLHNDHIHLDLYALGTLWVGCSDQILSNPVGSMDKSVKERGQAVWASPIPFTIMLLPWRVSPFTLKLIPPK